MSIIFLSQCHKLVEEAETYIEEWWFKKQQDTDLHDYLCIESLKSCCPSDHYGPECTPCPGYPDRVCTNNGRCKVSLSLLQGLYKPVNSKKSEHHKKLKKKKKTLLENFSLNSKPSSVKYVVKDFKFWSENSWKTVQKCCQTFFLFFQKTILFEMKLSYLCRAMGLAKVMVLVLVMLATLGSRVIHVQMAITKPTKMRRSYSVHPVMYPAKDLAHKLVLRVCFSLISNWFIFVKSIVHFKYSTFGLNFCRLLSV